MNVANGGGGDQEDGGAVYINTGTLTTHGGTFTDNNVNDYGGAIYNDEDPTSATLTGNMISWNFPENCEPIYTISGCSD